MNDFACKLIPPGKNPWRQILPQSVISVDATEICMAALTPEEELCARNFGIERRVEFQAGRSALKYLLSSFEPNTVFSIPIDPQGKPCIPWPYTGSITHQGGYCAAAIALKHEVSSFGIDVADNISITSDIRDILFTARERAILKRIENSFDEIPWSTIIFSAKESAYKALFNLEFALDGYHAIEIIDYPNESILFGMQCNLLRNMYKEIRVEYCFDKNYIYTACSIR